MMAVTCVCPHRYAARCLIGHDNGLLREIVHDVGAPCDNEAKVAGSFVTASEMLLEASPIFVAYVYRPTEGLAGSTTSSPAGIAHRQSCSHTTMSEAVVVCGMKCCLVNLESSVVQSRVALPFFPRSVAACGAFVCMSPCGTVGGGGMPSSATSATPVLPVWNPRHLLLIDGTHAFANGVLSATVKDHLPPSGGQIITPSDKTLRMVLAIEAHPLSPFLAAIYNSSDVVDPATRNTEDTRDEMQLSVTDITCVVFAFNPSKRCVPVFVVQLADMAAMLGDKSARLIRTAFIPTRVGVLASPLTTSSGGPYPYENLHVVVALSCGVVIVDPSASDACSTAAAPPSISTANAVPAIVYLNPFTRNPLIALGPLWLDDPYEFTVVTRNQSRIALNVCFTTKTCRQISTPAKSTWQLERLPLAYSTRGMPATDVGGLYVHGTQRLVLVVERASRQLSLFRLNSNASRVAGCVVHPGVCLVASALLTHHIHGQATALSVALQISTNDGVGHSNNCRPTAAAVVVPLPKVSRCGRLMQLLVSFDAGTVAVTCRIHDYDVRPGQRRLDGSYAPVSFAAVAVHAMVAPTAPYNIEAPTFHVVDTPAATGRTVAAAASPRTSTLWVVHESPSCVALHGHPTTALAATVPSGAAGGGTPSSTTQSQRVIGLSPTTSDLVLADGPAMLDRPDAAAVNDDVVVLLQRSLGVLEILSCSSITTHSDRKKHMLRYNIPRRGCTSDAIVGNVLCRRTASCNVEIVLAQRASITRSKIITSSSDIRIHHAVFSPSAGGAWAMVGAHDAWLYPWPAETPVRLHWYDASQIAVTSGTADENDTCWIVELATGVVMPWGFSNGTPRRSSIFSTPFTRLSMLFTEQHAVSVTTHALLSPRRGVEEYPMCVRWSSMSAAVPSSMRLLRALKESLSDTPIVDDSNDRHPCTPPDIMATLMAACGGRLRQPVTAIISSFGIGLAWLMAELDLQLRTTCFTAMDRSEWVVHQLHLGVRGILLPTLRCASCPWVVDQTQHLDRRVKELYTMDSLFRTVVLAEPILAEWATYVHHKFWSPLLRVQLQRWVSKVLVADVGRVGGAAVNEQSHRLAVCITSAVEPSTESGEGFLQMARAPQRLHGGHGLGALPVPLNIDELCAHGNSNGPMRNGHRHADGLHAFRMDDAPLVECSRRAGKDTHDAWERSTKDLDDIVAWRHDMEVRTSTEPAPGGETGQDSTLATISPVATGTTTTLRDGSTSDAQGVMRAEYMKSYSGGDRHHSSDESDDGVSLGAPVAGRLRMKGAIVLKPKTAPPPENGEQLAMRIFPGEKNGAAIGRVGTRASKGFEPLFESLETKNVAALAAAGPRGDQSDMPVRASDDHEVNVLRVGTPPSSYALPTSSHRAVGSGKHEMHRRVGSSEGEPPGKMNDTTAQDLLFSAFQAFDQANYSSAASLFQLVYTAHHDQKQLCSAYYKLSKVLAQCSPSTLTDSASPKVSLETNQACMLAAALHLSGVKRYHLLLPAMLLVDVVVERQLWEAAKAVSDFIQFLRSTSEEDSDGTAQFLWFREHAVALDNLSATCRQVDSYCEGLPQTPHDGQDRCIINVLLADESSTLSFLPNLEA